VRKISVNLPPIS